MMMIMFLCIALSAFFAEVEPSDALEFRSPLIGGGGGTVAYNLDCGSAAVLTGLTYKSGINLDRVSVTCRKINSDGTLGATFTGSTTGGTGGFVGSSNCAINKVVGGITVWAGGVVNGIQLECCDWIASLRKPNNTSTPGTVAGSVIGIRQGPFDCPVGMAGKALRGRSGIYVDSVMFVCDDFERSGGMTAPLPGRTAPILKRGVEGTPATSEPAGQEDNATAPK